jgi:hypothetical protein
MDITKSELIQRYNEQVVYVRNLPDMPVREILSLLSDEELFIFIAGQTLSYGRSFEKSIENAKYHMNKGRESVIKQWSTSDSERAGSV